MLTKVSNYKKWLKAISDEMEIPEERIIGRSHAPIVSLCRHTFYWLCFKDKIDLYELSVALGKDRTTVVTTIRDQSKRDKELENRLYNQYKDI